MHRQHQERYAKGMGKVCEYILYHLHAYIITLITYGVWTCRCSNRTAWGKWRKGCTARGTRYPSSFWLLHEALIQLEIQLWHCASGSAQSAHNYSRAADSWHAQKWHQQPRATGIWVQWLYCRYLGSWPEERGTFFGFFNLMHAGQMLFDYIYDCDNIMFFFSYTETVHRNWYPQLSSWHVHHCCSHDNRGTACLCVVGFVFLRCSVHPGCLFMVWHWLQMVPYLGTLACHVGGQPD